ncbi:MAG: sulfotransferase [Phycisphaerales bacterium]|jgi:hypothetical protein|nr:sulfotransferase [Phycisphaerales bacterium]
MSALTAVVSSHLRTPHLIVRNIRWRMPRTVSDRRLIFVVGAPRSGTTLLQRVLASHSKLFSIQGETGIFSARNIFARDHFKLSKEDTSSLFVQSKDIVDFFSRGVGLLESRHGEGTFVEKTPQHVKHLRFLVKHFPEARFIHIVRDGRDCFCSAQSHPNIPQRSSVATFARYWRSCICCASDVEDVPNVFTVRYEDFTAEPGRVLAGIMASLDLELEQEPGQLDPTKTGKDQRSEFAHFRRLTSSISSETVARWQREMTHDQVAAFELIAGAELLRHGYKLHAST